MINLALYFILTFVVIYLCLLSYFYFIQDRLVFPGAYLKPNYLLYKSINALAVTIPSKPSLQGWCIQGSDARSNNIAVYFGGNGEDVANILDLINKIKVSKIYSFNYRGYALSKGKISEQGIYDDSLAIFDFLKQKNTIKNIIVVGQSLGTAVAGNLAIKRDISKLILISPFTNIKKVANRFFPFLLFSYILRSTFNLEECAGDIKCPVLVIIAEGDTIVPASISRELYSLLGENKRISVIPGVEHNNILLSKNTFAEVNRFL